VVGPISSQVLGGLFLLLGFAGRDLLGRPLAGGLRYLAVRGVAAVESTTPEARYTAE